jgi:hypothetical protein
MSFQEIIAILDVRRHQNIVPFITFIVILTIGIQTYWNYILYSNNRLQVIHEIQNLLDKVTKDYVKSYSHKSPVTETSIKDRIEHNKTDSIQKIVKSVVEALVLANKTNPKYANESSISFSIIQNNIDLILFDKMLNKVLKNNNYDLKYNLVILQKDKVVNSLGRQLKSTNILEAKSQLTPFISTSVINLSYSDPILPLLYKGITGIIISFLLCSIVIYALYYLLKIIKQQKELSEMKNDFISNVTHEFKTPIATVTSALEAIKIFNNENITDKTKRYLDISEEQLKKLNLLVEKAMETSLLESSELELDYQKIDIIKLVKINTERHQLNTTKRIIFKNSTPKLEYEIDEFHFENAVSNLIDNAIKYGGDEIHISIYRDNLERILISVNDNGIGISKQDEPFIFDKLYRSKTLNFSSIKGFGIGLYYTKNIIEKHNGTIELKNPNTFLITLWTK